VPKGRRGRAWPSLEMSPRERASQAMRRLEDLTRLVSEWVWETDAEFRFTFVSERCFEMLDIVPQLVIGRGLEELGTLAGPDGTPVTLKPKTPFRDLPFNVERGDGEVLHLLLSGLPVFDPNNGALSGYMGTARDITAFLASERARQELEERRRAFVADVAHELRTPLAILKSDIDNLGLDRVGLGDASAQLHGDVDDMTRLISQLLTFTRYEALQLHDGEEVDLAEIAVSVAAQLGPFAIADGRTIEVDVDGAPTPIPGSALGIEHVVRNLVENALKYGFAGTPVLIRVSEGPKISVIDQGPGVPEELREKIFARFQQVDRRADPAFGGGAGLGLAIVKRIVDLHGGTVHVKDADLGGACFEIGFDASSR